MGKNKDNLFLKCKFTFNFGFLFLIKQNTYVIVFFKDYHNIFKVFFMKKFWQEKNKKVVIILFSVMAVTVSVCIMGIVNIRKVVITEKQHNADYTIIQSTEIASEIPKKTKLITPKYSFQLDRREIALKKGSSHDIRLAGGVKKSLLNLTWKSENPKIITVDKNGKIKGIAKGKTIVLCTDDDTDTTLKVTVTVSEPIYPESITLDKESYLMTSLKQPLKLTAILNPEKSVTEKKLTWQTDDESVATVKDGLVKSVGEGNAIITCTTENGLSAYCYITVETPIKVTDIYSYYEEYEFIGPQIEDVQLTAVISPYNATNQSVRWHSTDTNVALVDKEGNITIVGDGECDAVCTTMDGTYLSSSCHIIAEGTMLPQRHDPSVSVYIPVDPVPADTVIHEAFRYVGKIPYIWGGTDLASGVDCSGFICSVYERFGINLWGIRTDLYLAGEEVASIEEAKEGDILCYPGHVALYDGHGGRVHAYDEGYMVMRDCNIGGYYTIRRVME